jgi:hypothetical protein
LLVIDISILDSDGTRTVIVSRPVFANGWVRCEQKEI